MPYALPLFDGTRICGPQGDLRPPLREITDTGLQAAGQVASDMIALGDLMVATFADRSVRGFAADSLSERWAVDLPDGPVPSRFQSAPILVGDKVVLQTAGHWECFALEDGALIDAFDAPPIALRRCITQGETIIGTWWEQDSAWLGRYDIAEKKMRWSHRIDGPADGLISLCDGIAALALSDTCLGGFDAERGGEIWRCDIARIGKVEGPFAAPTGLIAGWPVALARLFLLPVQAGHWVGIEPVTGAIHWRCKLDNVDPGVAAIVGDHVLCLSEGFAAAFAPATGERIWSTTFSDPGRGHYCAPVPSAGYVWAVGARDGRMVAIDTATGALAWHGPGGGLTPPDRPPLLLADRLISVDIDGNVRVAASA